MNNTLLTTGGAGFIGSNLICFLLEAYPEYKIGKSGKTYNIGGRNEKDNLYIVNYIYEVLDAKMPAANSYKNLINFVTDRAGHDRRYAIDATKIENDLGWKADENFETGIIKTIDWYLQTHLPTGKIDQKILLDR